MRDVREVMEVTGSERGATGKGGERGEGGDDRGAGGDRRPRAKENPVYACIALKMPHLVHH